MRIEIKTKSPVKDRDIKALYLLNAAMEMSSPRMRSANLDFILSKWKRALPESNDKTETK